ncbi:MAG: beta-ribofuranosylaminobenzene 5'-phosphate synthase family protein [Planctomycetaceae bacterium]
MSVITVQTGARLHFGLLAVQAARGRNFGGVGLMIQSPGCELSVMAADRDECSAEPEFQSRLTAWRDEYRRQCPVERRPPACRIQLLRAMPSHSGLGSGTQTALALSAALAQLSGEHEVAATELARRVGRGARSALGIHGFERGGLLVEGGKREPNDISPLVARLDLPEEWRVLLVTPNDRRGLSGDAERAAFARLTPMPAALTESLCRIVLMELLPAIATGDFSSTASALQEFGQLNGSHFAPVQGGIFADPQMAELANWLIAQGCVGVGQSSWGPTLWVLCRDEAEAIRCREQIASRPSVRACTIHLTAAKNSGVASLR